MSEKTGKTLFFSRKCARLLQWVVFFRHERPTFLFICSTTSNSNLRSASKTKRKNKTDVHNLEITLKIPPLFFGTMRLFEIFGLNIFPQRVPPSIFLMFCNTMEVKKSQRVPLFYIFRHCDTVQKSH